MKIKRTTGAVENLSLGPALRLIEAGEALEFEGNEDVDDKRKPAKGGNKGPAKDSSADFSAT